MSCKANSVQHVKENTPQSVGCIWAMVSANHSFWHRENELLAQETVDNAAYRHIIVFTRIKVLITNKADEGRHRQKIQARVAQAAWDAEPTSRIRSRPTVSGRRFLRLRGSRAGKVRNDSARESGQATSQPFRIGFWVFAPHVLPSRSRVPAQWTRRTLAAKTGTTAGPQVDARGSCVCDAAAIQRAFDSSRRVSGRNQTAVQRDCPSAQRRACFGAAGKKTALEKAVPVKETQALVSAYEELRRQAVGPSAFGGLGMALLLGQGMVAWMQACSWIPSTASHNSPLLPACNLPVPHGVRGEIIMLLAAMALRQVPEVHP